MIFSRGLALRIRRNWKKWGWWRTFLITIILRFRYRTNTGTYVLDEKWDNLIILDACRFDAFLKAMEADPLPGRLESRISRGADTTSFLVQNFGGRKCGDIVYLSANPTVGSVTSRSFWKILPVWKQNLRPETLTRRAVEAIQTYPDKRLVIHYLQPHHPYLGLRLYRNPRRKYTDLLGVYTAGAYAMIEKKTQVVLYERNLRFVWPHVKNLLEQLPGKTVVTADHGEAFGEKVGVLRLWGHGAGARIPALVLVPWLVAENKAVSREKVVWGEETGERLARSEEEDIRRRLVDLGYE